MSITIRQASEVADAVEAANDAAAGDSNDDEIGALSEALVMALDYLEQLGVEISASYREDEYDHSRAKEDARNDTLAASADAIARMEQAAIS